MIKLYYSNFSCAMVVHIVLELLKADYEAIKVQIWSEDYKKISPKWAVPAIIDTEIWDEAMTQIVAILKYLSETKTCISGDISDQLPLSRTTVSQHLKELRDSGLIHGEIDGLKINYCLCDTSITEKLELFDTFFGRIKSGKMNCGVEKNCK